MCAGQFQADAGALDGFDDGAQTVWVAPWLEEHAGLIAEELNVKQVEFIDHAEEYISYTVLPDLKKLGPKLGKRLPGGKLPAASSRSTLATMSAALGRRPLAATWKLTYGGRAMSRAYLDAVRSGRDSQRGRAGTDFADEAQRVKPAA